MSQKTCNECFCAHFYNFLLKTAVVFTAVFYLYLSKFEGVILNEYIVKNGKKLKTGYTTGSCATAAATVAFEALLSQKTISKAKIKLPSGEEVTFAVDMLTFDDDSANCTIVKDAGDDPDVTHGAKICALVSLSEDEGYKIDGGVGVGRVTSEGLKQNIGEAAINPVPLSMIKKNMVLIAKKFDYKGGARVIISVPDGEEIAKNTFNARLGIIGGISILGTTGIVEPMSEKAIVDTVKLTIDKIAKTQNECILLVFGNYGEEHCKNNLDLSLDNCVQISNFVGESLDYIKFKGFKKVLLVGHTGKIIKLAGSIMDTHSKAADCRMEIIAAHAALQGASRETIQGIMSALTTDKAFEIIQSEIYFRDVLSSISKKISFHVNYRVKNDVEFAFYAFSSEDKFSFSSDNYNIIEKYFK